MLDLDVLIVGGGVAGLWMLTELRQRGYAALLVEAEALGTGQTIWSQGIIHGGMKYALTGEMSKAARAIAEMPGVWRDCLAGRGAIDLRGVVVLSPHQYLWTAGGAAARLGAFAASKLLRARPEAVSESDRPAALSGAGKNCRIYRLDEPVLEMRSLLDALAKLNAGFLFRAAADGLTFDLSGNRPKASLAVGGAPSGLTLQARAIVCAAGAGNEALCAALNVTGASMQRRPLHQVLLRGDLPPLFGHAVAGLSDKPRLTITSAVADDGETVWNIGGDVAEAGVERSSEAQRRAAAEALAATLPWLDFTRARMSTQRVDRAEPRTRGGTRPDLPFVHRDGALYVCWPTKLAFAPRLANDVVRALRADGVKPAGEPCVVEPAASTALRLATPPWDEPDRTWYLVST